MSQAGRPPVPKHRVKHGTYAGYRWHIRQKEQACPRCSKANADRSRQFDRRRAKQRIVLRSMLYGTQNKTKLTKKEFREIMKTIKEDLDNAGQPISPE